MTFDQHCIDSKRRYALFRFQIGASILKRLIDRNSDTPPIEFRQAYQQAWESLREGDNLMYGCKAKGHQSRLFDRLAEALAVISFEPDGCECFDFKFSASGGVARMEFREGIVIEECDWIGDKQHQLSKAIRILVPQQLEQILTAGQLPDGWQDRIQRFENFVAERGETLLYPDKKTIGQVQEMIAEMAFCIAVLALVPGGVEVFGVRFEAGLHGSRKA